MGSFFSCLFSGTSSTLCNQLYESLGVCPFVLQTQVNFFAPVFTGNSTQQRGGRCTPEAWICCILPGEKEEHHSWWKLITCACYCVDGWCTGILRYTIMCLSLQFVSIPFLWCARPVSSILWINFTDLMHLACRGDTAALSHSHGMR